MGTVYKRKATPEGGLSFYLLVPHPQPSQSQPIFASLEVPVAVFCSLILSNHVGRTRAREEVVVFVSVWAKS